MRKIISVLVMALIFTSLIIPSSAYTGGLLNGKRVARAPHINQLTGYTDQVTDNKENTSMPIGADGTATDTNYVYLEAPHAISSYKVKADNPSVPFHFEFYDSTKTLISSVTDVVNDGTLTNIDTVTGVYYVALVNKGTKTVELYEMDVFGYSATPPGEATKVVTQPLSGTSIKISWTNPSDIDFSETELYKDGVKIATIPKNENSYIVTGLSSGTSYNFKIITVDEHGNKSSGVTFSEKTLTVDETPPAEIKDLKSFLYSDRIKFTWTNPPDIDYHEVRIFRDGQQIAVAVTPANQFTDYDLSEHTTYTFVFRSVDTSGNVSAGISVTETTKGKPRGTVTLYGEERENSVSLFWTSNPEATNYIIYQDGEAIGETTETHYIVTELENDVKYTFTVAPANEFGVGSKSNEIILIPIEIPIPNSPNVSFTSSDKSITLSWERVQHAEKYNIYNPETKISETTGTSYTINGLTEGTEYSFLISAENQKGESPKTTIIVKTKSLLIPKDMSINVKPWEVVYNSIVLIGSLGSIILLALAFYFSPRLIQLLKQSTS